MGCFFTSFLFASSCRVSADEETLPHFCTLLRAALYFVIWTPAPSPDTGGVLAPLLLQPIRLFLRRLPAPSLSFKIADYLANLRQTTVKKPVSTACFPTGGPHFREPTGGLHFRRRREAFSGGPAPLPRSRWAGCTLLQVCEHAQLRARVAECWAGPQGV